MNRLRVIVTLNFKLMWPPFLNNYIWSISLLLLEVGIPNVLCECILEWLIVPFHFPLTESVTLTSDLVSRIGTESGA